MKGVNNRQKMIVRPRETVQKNLLTLNKLRKGLKRRTSHDGPKNPATGHPVRSRPT